MAVGAILTQNTNWGNVERAIENLKRQKALSAKAIHGMTHSQLASLIRPAGYFNIKAKRLKAFVEFLISRYRGSMKRMAGEEELAVRVRLLAVHGIGPETADSIILYALGHPVFVIDAYTKRVLSRHGIMERNCSYDRFQELFHSSLRRDKRLFNEYHALLVRVAKEFCNTKPRCGGCPLEGL
ncbi:MAG: hypothetical protein Q8J64_05345 [Thermodesulfovibrionales bacterium]|nr:hypothetical protein [Thermodesulfovibrionales bacterium]